MPASNSPAHNSTRALQPRWPDIAHRLRVGPSAIEREARQLGIRRGPGWRLLGAAELEREARGAAMPQDDHWGSVKRLTTQQRTPLRGVRLGHPRRRAFWCPTCWSVSTTALSPLSQTARRQTSTPRRLASTAVRLAGLHEQLVAVELHALTMTPRTTRIRDGLALSNAVTADGARTCEPCSSHAPGSHRSPGPERAAPTAWLRLRGPSHMSLSRG
jgi:hypothetical protein